MKTTPFQDPARSLWPLQPTLHMPEWVEFSAQPVLSLDGMWKFHPHPPESFWSEQIVKDSWHDQMVPGTNFAQGYELKEGAEYAYHRRVEIPENFGNQRVYLRFDGVTGKARIWVNGTFVRSHYGGHTTWYCEITRFSFPGAHLDLTVGVTDVQTEISIFNFGGIIRNVQMVAVPACFFSRFQITTELSDQNETAEITVALAVEGSSHKPHCVRVCLLDPHGHTVEMAHTDWDLDLSELDSRLSFLVRGPTLWDAEHPNLYQLQLELIADGQLVEKVSRRFGIRTVRVLGRELLVNGRPVKLRGVNRHDVHLITGRTVTSAQVEADVLLFKEANINFIRTSHYPPRQDFLEFCDEYGIYVEDETSVAFVYQSIQPTQNDPDFTAAYMDQLAEMIERDRSHPSVIMWSLANECYWGTNFQREFDYTKTADPSRPIIFSYPNTMPADAGPCDIWSSHYANWDRNPGTQSDNWSRYGHIAGVMPVLHDEFAHIACYNRTEQRRDPAVREFWGESLKRWWESIFATPGALGGAIWGGIDDEIITPEGYTTNREWGIIDGWRRRKPEHWLTKKAYSPVRLQDWLLPLPQPNGLVQIPLANWFDHTNLSELTIHWRAGSAHGSLAGPKIEPHSEGYLELPPEAVQQGAPVHLKFVGQTHQVVDEFLLTPEDTVQRVALPVLDVSPELVVEQERLLIQHPDFHIETSMLTGMVTAEIQGQRVIEGGPYLVLTGIPLAAWKVSSVTGRQEKDCVLLRIAGWYGDIEVEFSIRVDGAGGIMLEYRIPSLPYSSPRSRMLRAGSDVGGFREVGVAFDLVNQVDRLKWDRKGLWSVYPKDHIGRNKGEALRERKGGDESFRQKPDWFWSQDMRNYSLFGRHDVGGRGTHDFRSMKHNIREATALLANSQAGFTVHSALTTAVRMEVLEPKHVWVPASDPAVRKSGTWQQAVPGSKLEWFSNKRGDFVEYEFEGTGICWIGATDMIYGEAQVWLDNVQVACVDLFPGIPHGSARGEVKQVGEILFSSESLETGIHTIRIEVLGTHQPLANNAFVSVEGFRILQPGPMGAVRCHILNAWNYPELTWGNYMKEPIVIESGYVNRVQVQIHGS